MIECIAAKVDGEYLNITQVTRGIYLNVVYECINELYVYLAEDMGAYLCISSNGVPPSVSKRILVQINCKYNLVLYCIVYYDLIICLYVLISRM